MRGLYMALCAVLAPAAMADQPDADSIATALIARRFDLTPARVTKDVQESGIAVDDLPPAYTILDATHASPSTLWQLHRQGLGWDEIATQLHMPETRLGQARKNGDLDADSIWQSVLQSHYGLDARETDNLHRLGHTWKNVIGAIVVGHRQSINPMNALQTYLKFGSWPSVAARPERMIVPRKLKPRHR